MITHLRILTRLYLPHVITTLFLFGCAANPLTPGSLSLKNSKEPLGFADSGQPLLIDNLTGSPFILYVKSKWCPLCKNLDSILEEEFMVDVGRGSVILVTLELVERRILDQSGVNEVITVPGKKTGVIPGLPEGRESSNHYVGDSGRVKKILRLNRIPALIGFNKKGQVAGTLYGFQSDMDEKIDTLRALMITEHVDIKGKSAF